jgi:hypothetical protein
MRIDEEEIRFWVRKIKIIKGAKNTNIETDLFNEIPKFLKYLMQLPAIDFSKSRMVFTKDEILTESLQVVMEESKAWLRKEIKELFQDYFDNNTGIEFIEVTAKDLKDRWFVNNNNAQISYIRKVLKEEMKLIPSELKRYKVWPDLGFNERVGQVFKFDNHNIPKKQVVKKQNDSVDDPNEEMPNIVM